MLSRKKVFFFYLFLICVVVGVLIFLVRTDCTRNFIKNVKAQFSIFQKDNRIKIFFASDENYAKYLCVAMTSILVNADKDDEFTFYILDGGLSSNSKTKILQLKKIKNFKIEFISVNDEEFKKLPLGEFCFHVPRQTYYRYIIPVIKPRLKKVLYLDADIVVTGSLKELWNIDLEDNYVAVVEELHYSAPKDAKSLGVNYFFNAGVLLINNKLWQKDGIPDKLFKNTVNLYKQNLLRVNDQSAMNYTFGEKVLYISPKYNLQQNAFYDGQHSRYTDEDMKVSIRKPLIIHFNGNIKPWHDNCEHAYKNLYFKYLLLSPYKTTGNNSHK